ncbi:hypothetical protein ACFVVU_30855 [Kitasatospora sp. NPDC057965]|uniref:hypothetical protein n=1 Tax=Kitasatospora sp. NPDC057965 TaxID=3346291 RepID=UPI0036D83EFA
MRTTVFGRQGRSRRTVGRAAATVLATALAGGTVLLAAPTASASPMPTGKLKVNAPASVGGAGQPVEFTETITNTGSQKADYHLHLRVTGDGQVPGEHAIVIDYRDPAKGTWKSVPLNVDRTGSLAYDGEVPRAFEIPAHSSVTLRLRIGVPMGLPHDGASNGWLRSMALESRLGIGARGAAADIATKTIKVQNISPSLGRVPATAVAGGAPIEFDAVLKNPTPSNYINVANTLGVDSHATVQVRQPNGTWTTLKKFYNSADEGAGVYLQGRDSSIRANSTTTVRVRVSYDAGTPLGPTDIGRCVYVNERPTLPFRGTTTCVQGATVQIVAPGTKGAKGQSSVKPAPSTKGTSAGK